MSKIQKRILLVDDEKDIVELLREEFEDFSYKTTPAFSGREAIKCLTVSQFDIVLSDFKMSDGNGLDLLNFVNTIEKKIRPLFFFLSGYSHVPKNQLIQAGALNVFSKPFDIIDVIKNIEKNMIDHGRS